LYVPTLAGAEPRLQGRYHQLIVSQLSSAQRLAAGVHAPPTLAKGFATTQAAWRFYSNDRVTLPGLCAPLLEHARTSAAECCDQWLLVVLDWSNLHYNSHESKTDRVALSMKNDLGYEMLTALGVSDRDGSPIAPLCLELRAADGLYTTRCTTIQKPASPLDGLEPVMDQVLAQSLGKPTVFIIDREADSIAHYRRWDGSGKKFVIRANDKRLVLHQGREQALRQVADDLRWQLKPSRPVLYKGKPTQQFVGETTIVLNRAAYQHRVDGKNKRKKHKIIPGPALVLRLIVAEVRDKNGKVLARWLLMSNLPSSVPASEIALWYYWRWRIEPYHKLLKSAGEQIEQWQQETAATLVRRLLVTAMSAVLVWHIARDTSPQSQQLRITLVKLSGRQTKRTRNSRGFTEPALLAGLNVAIPMMILLEQMSVEELKSAAHELMPLIRAVVHRRRYDDSR
jgi:Transposase DDE domain